MSQDQGAPDLRPLSDAPAELELIKSSWRKQAFEIVGGGWSFAHIDYTFTGKATARSADGTWAFSRMKGALHRRIEVVSQDGQLSTELDLQAWKRGGTIELGGAFYVIRAEGLISTRWSCERDGQELFAVQEIHSLGKEKGAISLSDLGRADPNISLLLLLAVDVDHAVEHQNSGSAGGAGGGM
jgi:hypothetical protein